MTAGLGRLLPLLLGVGVAELVALGGPVATAAPAAIRKIKALNGKAIAAYEAGDSKKAERLLQDAVVLSTRKPEHRPRFHRWTELQPASSEDL